MCPAHISHSSFSAALKTQQQYSCYICGTCQHFQRLSKPNQMESLFQLLDARWFSLLQLFPRILQAICVVFNYDFDTFCLTTLFTITIQHLFLYSIVSSHLAKIQTSREYSRKWTRLQNLIPAGPFNTVAQRRKKNSLHKNFDHQ